MSVGEVLHAALTTVEEGVEAEAAAAALGTESWRVNATALLNARALCGEVLLHLKCELLL